MALSCRQIFSAYAVLAITIWTTSSVSGQMVADTKIPGFSETMGVDLKNEKDPYSCQFISSTAPGNVLWPGEQASFTFQVVNTTKNALSKKGFVELISYGTRGRPGDIWTPDMFRFAAHGKVPIEINLLPGKSQNITITPNVPDKFGPYALVVDLGSSGRRFVASFVRTFKPEGNPPQYPQLALDVENVDVLRRLGACPNRIGIPFKAMDDPGFEKWLAEQSEKLDALKNAKLPIIAEFCVGDFYGPTQPLGRPRPWLDEHGTMLKTKMDITWLPSYDGQFKKQVKILLEKYGWPRGPIIAVKFMNEPWEGISISGWGADNIRYREIFQALIDATLEARNEYKVNVLIGGCDSSTNTMDKLFADGTDDMLKYLDFCSIHYQGMMAPSTIRAWQNRTGPNGRVKIWDTESWVANCDDRVAAVMATNLSAGYDRAVGVYGGNIATMHHSTGVTIQGDDGKSKRIHVTQTWSVAASIGAAQHFIGERRFKELLFKNGLPWVMVFDGLPDSKGQTNPEDGTVVVVGDIGEEFGHDHILFRNAKGFAQIAHKRELNAKLAALPAEASSAERADLEKAIASEETLSNASMTILSHTNAFALFDFYGNTVPPPADGKMRVPLDGRGFFLRGNGNPGSFASLLSAIRQSHVDGIEPLAKQVRDMLTPVDQHGSSFRLELTNVLNRPVRGELKVSVAGLRVAPETQTLELGANETRMLNIAVSGQPRPDNTYAMQMTFDGGVDGKSEWQEDLHVNQIAHRTITVDGDLSEWTNIPPQIIRPGGSTGPSLTEQAWLPFEKFNQQAAQGSTTAYLAYDDQYFYFAAKIADSTPDGGTLRFENRNDDEYFYPAAAKGVEIPAISRGIEKDVRSGDKTELKELSWPENVRRYSYRKRPALPSGSTPAFDNVLIAFNVLDEDRKPTSLNPPGTIPNYLGYADSDYEYALNKVADAHGGGTEVWRLQVPGMPRKQFYPRQPKSPFDGPVKNAKLVVSQSDTTRVVECAIPWSEMPDVKKQLDAGKSVKFDFRVNDDKTSSCMELARGRSVAKRNSLTFHPDWVEHWANEVEFSFERPNAGGAR